MPYEWMKKDRTIYPLKIKKSATPKKDDVRHLHPGGGNLRWL